MFNENKMKGNTMTKKKVAKKKIAKKKKGIKVQEEKKPVIIQYFYPPDGRTEFCKPYMKPGAALEIVEQFGSHATRVKYAIRNLVKVRFVGQKETDMLSPSCIKRRLRKDDE